MLKTFEIEAPKTTLLDEFSERQKIDIEQLVKTKLFPLPNSVSRILELLRDVNVTAKEIADVISYDPIMATRVLKLANSPLYALQRGVTTIHHAVSAVGIRSVYDIVMLGVASDNFSKFMRYKNSGVSVWEHSVAVAISAREISQFLQIRGTEEAFTCGLLHDIGQTLLYQTDPKQCKEIFEANSEEKAIRMEEVLFGYNHMQVGFFVAHNWELPEAVCSAILYHHKPKKAPHALVISHIINVADDLVTKKGFGMDKISDQLPQSESVRALRLTTNQLQMAWEKTEESLYDVLKNFR